MKEAKEEQRQIVVSCIDLANAYGSVRHNLIQFALDWYHVPKRIQTLIFNYYEKLMAKVVTKEWSSDFFLFDIGLFQGCVLSTILFLCVFQLLLDFLKPLRTKYGYDFKQTNTNVLAEAYAGTGDQGRGREPNLLRRGGQLAQMDRDHDRQAEEVCFIWHQAIQQLQI